MDKETREGLKTLISILETFKDIGGSQGLELQTLLAFFYIALTEHEDSQGLNVNTIGNKLGSTTASASRNITILNQGHVKAVRPGLGLVTTYEDPNCRIKKIVELTPKGRRLRDRLMEMLANESCLNETS